MKILLAPSESKKDGINGELNLKNLIFPQITPQREHLINAYQKIINRGDIEELKELFGLKKESEIEKYLYDIKKAPTNKAIKIYEGVAFDYIDYDNLDSNSQNYIDKNLLIFSNLFGVVRANDFIPKYKIKQGSIIDGEKIEKYYHNVLKEPLDEYLKNDDILDIRAGYYDKFYKPSKFYTTLKFLKDGKVVSHWAKAYRGLVLRYCAINKIDNIKDFIAMDIEQLQIKEIIKSKTKQEVIYEISN